MASQDQIAKACQDLTTAAEMQETTQMLMQPNANWEEYLTPAPLSIAIMGELVFISSNDDFSINTNPPKTGFVYMKYPDSFRASLMQVCNSGWNAFNKAHKNMDQIRIHTATVPGYMKATVKILFHGTDEVVKTLLPNQLDNINTIADDCVTLAEGVEKEYSYVIKLIQELLEACVSAKHFHGEELEKVKMRIEEAKLREKSAQEMNKRSKKAMESLSKNLEEAQDGFKESMASLPSGWEMIGMDFVEGLSTAFTTLIDGVTTLVTAKLIKKDKPNKDGDADALTVMEVYSKSAEILEVAASLKKFFNESGIDFTELYDQKNKCTKTAWTLAQFQRISENLKKKSDCSPKQNALSLCESGNYICNELAKYDPENSWDEKVTEELVQKLKKLNDDARVFDSVSKKQSGSPALTATPPNMAKAESSGRKTASQKASDNARFRIEQSREQLKNTREAYEKSVANMEKNQKELTDILVEMQNCKIKEIDFSTTIKMLVKGLDAMGRVKEQWEKMVRFFQMVSNIVKCSLSRSLHDFVKTSEDREKLSYNGKLFAKDLLYNQAFQASNIASLVHMISGTYTEVSNKYLMDRVSSLGKLLAMDSSKPEFTNERQQLQQSCKEAQEGILQLVLKNKKEFERKTNARMAKIESELKAVLPAAAPEETKKIKEIVQSGFSDEDEDNYI